MFNIQKIGNKNLFNLLIIIFLISSCSSMNVTEEVVYDGGIRTVEAAIQEETSLDYESKAIFTNATVYFEFDKFNLNSKSLQTLKSAVAAMKDNSSIKITISGHADERGTREYNLALGQRRAESVRDYFAINGINANRIMVKSYGEERPILDGSNEASYSKNRRAEIN
ncbi:peptidoglycan-associated lipoprotein Pal [Gammaproteobacteria bacterium]|mgnify:FL=1|jgi:peptidoglycan-associated lipoprotein|nr:peptidoglycan-associated lipoprotein Pal [Gammaproteobacteria bacterium]